MASSTFLAEWFWTDRWMGSSAFGLPIEARGLYREMLTQAWRRQAQLPNNHDQIRRMTGVTLSEWRRTWPLVERFWRVVGDVLVNDTQIEIYADAHARSMRATDRGKRGAQARHKHVLKHSTSNTQAPPQAVLEDKPLSLSPSETTSPQAPPTPSTPVNSRGKHPVYKGNRVTVFDWQLEDLTQILGKYADAFNLDVWFDTLDKRAMASGEVMPKRDGGRWLQQETLAEARRRGLPIAGESGASDGDDPRVSWGWQCATCGEVHEGTKEQAKARPCLKGRQASA